MTLETEPVSAPKSRAKPPVRRRPPPAPRPAAPTRDQGEVVDVAELARQNEELRDRLEQLERSNVQFVQGEPPPKANPRVADEAELTPWQRSLRAETKHRDPASMVRSEPDYNVPQRYYMRPDGDIVSLQADAKNLTYYTDVKGFRVLSRDEEQHYLKVERPRIVKLQQARANLINGIHRAVAIDPVLENRLEPTWQTDLDRMTVPELQDQFDEIAGMPMPDGRPRRMLKRLPRLQDADDQRAEVEAQRLMAGVETGKKSREDVQRLIELTPKNANQFA